MDEPMDRKAIVQAAVDEIMALHYRGMLDKRLVQLSVESAVVDCLIIEIRKQNNETKNALKRGELED